MEASTVCGRQVSKGLLDSKDQKVPSLWPYQQLKNVITITANQPLVQPCEKVQMIQIYLILYQENLHTCKLRC